MQRTPLGPQDQDWVRRSGDPPGGGPVEGLGCPKKWGGQRLPAAARNCQGPAGQDVVAGSLAEGCTRAWVWVKGQGPGSKGAGMQQGDRLSRWGAARGPQSGAGAGQRSGVSGKQRAAHGEPKVCKASVDGVGGGWMVGF